MNKSYLLIALVAVAAIVAVVLVVFRVVNLGGCAENQTVCGGNCCQPDEICTDGSCQPKPPKPEPGSCPVDKPVCHLQGGVDRCCQPDACQPGVQCCNGGDGDNNVWCPSAARCCARDKCNSEGSCCKDTQVVCGTDCCDPKNCSTTEQTCCVNKGQLLCQGGGTDSCCDAGKCNATTGKCCPSMYDATRGCVQACGTNDKGYPCDEGSKCFSVTWDKAAAEALYKYCDSVKGSNCISQIDGQQVYLCLPNASCNLNMSDATPFPPAVNDFKPAYNFESGMKPDRPGIHATGQPPDCYKDTLGNTYCVHDVLAQEFGAEGDMLALSKDYRDKLGETLRTTLQSPLGYRCVGKNKTGWRWLFARPEKSCKEDDARQACMQAGIAEGNVTRVFYDQTNGLCTLEKCVGDACEAQNPLKGSDGSPSQASAPEVCSPTVAYTCPETPDSSVVCPKGCFKNDEGLSLDCWASPDKSGGWQLWQPGSDKLNICATHCHSTGIFDIGEHIGVVKNDSDLIVDSNGNAKDDLAAFCTQVNAFDWYADGTTATLQQVESGSWKDTDMKRVSMRSPPGSKNSNGGKYKSGEKYKHGESSNDEDVCTPFNDGPYSSNLFFHSNDVGKGSVEDIANCKVHCAN
jgi:hypothetical protein